MTKHQLPSLALVLVGAYLGIGKTLSYVQYAMDPPSHKLGLLAEFVLLVSLAAAAVLVGIGMYGFRRERPVLPSAVFVGVVVLWGTVVVDLYSGSPDTQFVVSLGLLVSVLPAVATYLFLAKTRYWDEDDAAAG